MSGLRWRSMSRDLRTICARNCRISNPLCACTSSRAASPIRRTYWRALRAATCCAASRRASCCLPRAPSAEFSGGAAALLLRRCERGRHTVLRHGARRRTCRLGAASARCAARQSRGNLRCDECHAGAAAFVRSGGPRTIRLRARRKLCSAPSRTLVQTVSRFRDRDDRGDGATDRVAAVESSTPGAGAAGAWRLSTRQHHSDSVATKNSRRARLGALHFGRSARGFCLSPHAMGHAAIRNRSRRGNAHRP